MNKAISIGYLTKVSAANVNSSYTEGNVIVTKKITMPDGSTIPYISGQAIRRMFRDRLEELGYALSEPFSDVNGQQVTPPVRPWDYIDEDLFGYLDPAGRRRTSPVRVSAAIGLFPFQGDRDLGTRSFERFGRTMAEGGNIFETELYSNLFKGAMLIEVDRVGIFPSLETSQDEKKELPINERVKRLQDLLESFNILWGGGRTARMLADLSPKFLVYSQLSVKHPVFSETLMAHYEDNKYLLEVSLIKNALDKFKNYLNYTVFGIEPAIFENEDEIKESLKDYGDVLSVHEAIQSAKKEVENLWNECSA